MADTGSNIPYPSLLPIASSQGNDPVERLNQLLRFEFPPETLSSISVQQSHLLARLKSIRSEVKSITRNTNQSILDSISYGWKLVLEEKLANPLCKGKYFSLKIGLKSLENEGCLLEKEVNVKVSLQTSDAQTLQINMLGGAILCGDTHCTLRYDQKKEMHCGCFRLKITEVSSHYVDGWVRVVVSACEAEDRVQSLVLEDVVVRSKEKICRKFLERERNGLPQNRVRNRHF